MGVTLYVGNLPGSTTDAELEILFKQIGEVTDLKIQRDPETGESRGFGYLTMGVQSEADRAVSRLDDYSLAGCRLKVRLVQRRVVQGIAGSLFEP